MRGLLRISSQRSPYLRAGLGWPTREPIEVDVRDLDGARLKELLDDPVLTILIGQDSGAFHPLPEIDRRIEIEALDLMIESLAAELPPLQAPASTDPIADELAAIAEKLGAGGFTSIDALITSHTVQSEMLVGVRAEVTRLTGELAATKTELTKTIADYQEARDALDRANAAAAKAPAAKTTKPKAAGTPESKPA